MKFIDGEITISPKVIYWAEMPSAIGEDEYIELLKRDVLLVDFQADLEKIQLLREKETEHCAFFFNLDKIMQVLSIRGLNNCMLNNQVVKLLLDYLPEKSMIHTTLIDENLAYIIKSRGIPYIEKNLDHKKRAIHMILKLIPPFFSRNGQVKRSSLRLKLYPLKFKVIVKNYTQKEQAFSAVVKDLSLSGIGIRLNERPMVNNFKLKDIVKLEIHMKPYYFNIAMGLVSRIDEKNLEIGIRFNINDDRMVKPVDADIITKIFYKWIKNILEQHGKIENQKQVSCLSS